MIINSPAELPGLVGQQLGVSQWHEITQEQVNQFADATGDHQWIHVDVERAKTGPFGGPIAHGYLTLSLASMLMFETFEIRGAAAVINYGLNKVRFSAPVPVGSRIRAAMTLVEARNRARGMIEATVRLRYELEGSDRSPCTAEAVFLYQQ